MNSVMAIPRHGRVFALEKSKRFAKIAEENIFKSGEVVNLTLIQLSPSEKDI